MKFKSSTHWCRAFKEGFSRCFNCCLIIVGDVQNKHAQHFRVPAAQLHKLTNNPAAHVKKQRVRRVLFAQCCLWRSARGCTNSIARALSLSPLIGGQTVWYGVIRCGRSSIILTISLQRISSSKTLTLQAGNQNYLLVAVNSYKPIRYS